MIDYKPTLKSNLETLGLPVYYELFVNGSTPTPCITYIEAGNYADLEGDTLLYSRLHRLTRAHSPLSCAMDK